MPKRTTSNGRARPQQECSDGAKMLIDQMKEHPEEFKGFAGKFTNMLDTATEVVRGNPRHMSQRDAVAIMAAAEEHLYEVWLAEDVLTKMMAPNPELKEDAQRAYAVGMGRGTSKSVLSGAITNSSNVGTAKYVEQVYRMEKERYKAELEAQRRRDLDYAQRNTTPFKDFL